MKFVLVLSALLAFAAAETYTSENDDFDIETMLGDADTLRALLDCFNDKGACDEYTAEIKQYLPEAVAEACGKCTTAQKHVCKRFLEVVKAQKPEDYKILEQKYDPQQKHLAALEAAIVNF